MGVTLNDAGAGPVAAAGETTAASAAAPQKLILPPAPPLKLDEKPNLADLIALLRPALLDADTMAALVESVDPVKRELFQLKLGYLLRSTEDAAADAPASDNSRGRMVVVPRVGVERLQGDNGVLRARVAELEAVEARLGTRVKGWDAALAELTAKTTEKIREAALREEEALNRRDGELKQREDQTAQLSRRLLDLEKQLSEREAAVAGREDKVTAVELALGEEKRRLDTRAVGLDLQALELTEREQRLGIEMADLGELLVAGLLDANASAERILQRRKPRVDASSGVPS